MTKSDEWWPTDYIDEVVPPARESPSAWIVVHDEGFALAGADELADDSLGPDLEDGAIVKFTYLVSFGEIDVTLTDSGYRLASPEPVGYEQCCILGGWQLETLAAAPKEMIDLLRESGAEAGEYVASFYTYVDAGPYRFCEATRAFEPVVEHA